MLAFFGRLIEAFNELDSLMIGPSNSRMHQQHSGRSGPVHWLLGCYVCPAGYMDV